MTSAQKIIKYVAIAFAFLIIVNIIGVIYFSLSTLSSVLGVRHSSDVTKELHEVEINSKSFSSLHLDLFSANLTIKKGNTLRIQTNSKDIFSKEHGNELLIKEKENHWYLKNKNKEVVVYLPENKFDEITIETGAGKINIDEINTKKIDFDLGAGKVDIKKLNVSEKAEFDGGAGEINILSGSIRNLDLDLGVGKCFLKSTLTGHTKVDAGVGEVELHVIGSEEDYQVKFSKGIGSIRFHGKPIKEDMLYGIGNNYVEIDGGVGSISLDFEK